MHAPMMGQPSGDGRHEGRADDGSQVVADAGAGVTHVRVEQFRQEGADRTERGTHQSEADAQEQQVGGEVALTDDRRVKQVLHLQEFPRLIKVSLLHQYPHY